MFGNFIFFILALLIYATYQPLETPRFGLVSTLLLALLLLTLFAISAKSYFKRLTAASLKGTSKQVLSQKYDIGIKQFSIYALILFAVAIYGLALPDHFKSISFFQTFPTAEALLFLSFFIGCMIIVWSAAHTAHKLLFPGNIPKKEYLLGQISFNLPVLLPWLALSTILDIINLLPFSGLKQFLETTIGQAIYFFVFLFIAAVLAPAVVKLFWRCRPLPSGPDLLRIQALCRRTGVAFAGILQWPLFGGRMITAGVMGLVSQFRYLLVTDALLSFLTPDEIDCVIAHELGHVKRKHLLFYLFFLGGYMLLSLSVLDLIIFYFIYSSPVLWVKNTFGFGDDSTVAFFFTVATIVMFVIYFRYIFGFFMRNFERQADTYVYTLFNSARPLISTLRKIAIASGQPINKPNWHHFSIGERIEYLEKCESDRQWVNRQDRKIKKGMILFIVSMLVVGVVGYQVNFGKWGEQIGYRFSEKILLEKQARHPQQPEFPRQLAGLYYQQKNYAKAISFYRLTLKIAPRDAEVLNNLAWLYATCEDHSFRNPQEALDLAKRAAAINPRPHVLDTLAESYYINRQFQNAIRAARLALKTASTNRSYYREQLEKFNKASNSV